MGTDSSPGPSPLRAAREDIADLAVRCDAAEREIARLRQAVDARDAFIAVAGAELRNPMGAIGLSISHLIFHVQRAGDLPPWLGERLDALDRRTRDFVRRSTTLLDVGRLAIGEPCLHREEFRLSDVVRWAISEIEPEASRAGCPLRLSIESDEVGSWDRTALRQVALHLLSNAVRFGGGAPVDISIHCDDEMAVFSVADRGAGISEVNRARIFDSFEGAVGARERAGFGLGLWIARQLVSAHGGDIAVQNDAGDAEESPKANTTDDPGGGTVFTVSVPRAPRSPGP